MPVYDPKKIISQLKRELDEIKKHLDLPLMSDIPNV